MTQVTFRGGRLPNDPAKPRLRLAQFLTPAALAEPPAAVNWDAAVDSWPLYGNSDWGDCVWAMAGHAIQAWTANAGTEATVTDADVLRGYSDVTGFDPNAGPPGNNPTDRGTVIQDALSYWRKTGIGGHRILAFAEVDVRDETQMQQAAALFGLVLLGMNFPASAMTQFDHGQPWDLVAHDGGIEGGHAILGARYDTAAKQWHVITWGAEQPVTFAFIGKYFEEAWVAASQEWVKVTGGAPSGLDVPALNVAFHDLTGEPGPFTPPGPPPPHPPGLDPAVEAAVQALLTDPRLAHWALNERHAGANKHAAGMVAAILHAANATAPDGHDPGERAELEAIAARLADPELERRNPRNRMLAETPGAVEEHAVELDRIAGTGVLFGPDVSQFQGRVDWAKVRAAGCVFGGYKVSEGRTFQDPQHQANRAAVPAAGLVPLAYHYLYGSAEYLRNPGLWAAQASWFCSLVDPDAIHALDVEAALPSPGLGVAAWVAEYRKHFPHKTLIVYSNRGMWLNRSHVGDPWPTAAPGWHAGYRDGTYTTARGSLAAQWGATGSLSNSLASLGAPACRLWQFTDHAAVPGVAGLCDGNAFQGSLTDLRALAAREPSTVKTVYGLLRKGDTDASTRGSVSIVQRVVGAKPDGLFGDLTTAAVKSYQSRHRLTPDGVVGQLTVRAFGPGYRYVQTKT